MSDVKVFEATRSGPNSRRRVKSTGFQAPERIRVAAYVRVSTDDDEQLGSFESQKSYYEDKIRENKEWAMAGIFADEAITGTNVNKREQFLEMIDRCMAGEIDMILTKSISRFARNTLDTLNYVRMLKDKNIAVIFEKENIDTLTMNGELMLTILSSLAQQEVESLSSNVKMGLAMKMQRGEMVGFNGCLGYDYHPEDKSMTILVTLNPGHSMNYHSHKLRDEVWVVVEGNGTAIVDGNVQNVSAGDVITMQAGCRHTVIAEDTLKIVEVQLGEEISVYDKRKHELE